MSEKIDVERVEKELLSALAADRKYSRENDAKIRAVTQRVATYDEFRLKGGGAEGCISYNPTCLSAEKL